MSSSRRTRRRQQNSYRRHQLRLEGLEKRYALNAAPVLDPSASPQLNSVIENAGIPVGQVGTLVSDLIDVGGTHNNFSDADGDLPGIAITGTNLQGGTLYYSTDNGSTWVDVGEVSETLPKLLSANTATRIYYEPTTAFTGSVSDVIAFKAWDQNYNWQQLGARINAEASGDFFGETVAISSDGRIVAVGAPWNGGNGYRSGHVRIFELNGAVWQQIGSDIDGDSGQSGFSMSLSSDGQTVAIGAPSHPGGTLAQAGQVRIYHFDGAEWQKVGSNINGESLGDLSGYSVSLSPNGNTVAIGSYSAHVDSQDSQTQDGQVQIFNFNGLDWEQVGNDIEGKVEKEWLGYSVSLSADGQTVAIGVPNDYDNRKVGHVRIYQLNGADWQQIGSDINGEAAGDRTGSVVSLSSDGQRVAVGAVSNDDSGENAGQVRTYQWIDANWQQIGSDINGEAALDYFGQSVSLSSDGQTMAIGAPYSDGNGSFSGHVQVYQWIDANWQQIGPNIGGEENSRLGQSVSISSDGKTFITGNSNSRHAGPAWTGFSEIYEKVPMVSLASGAISINVISINDAPVLDPSASPQLSAINEDAGIPVGQVGTLVSDLIDVGGTHNNFSDADGDLPGIAITGTNLQGGSLYYSTDDGATWQLVSAVTPSSSLTLLADSQTRIYFSPGADLTNEAGGTFTFRAWDRTGASTNGEQDVLATSTLSLVGNTATSGFLWNAAVSDDETRLFVADEWTGDLRVFDITNPVSPVQLGAYRLNLPLRVQTTSDPDLIYVADRSGDNPPLTVLDISNPSNIQAIKSLGTSNAGRKVILDEVSNKAYLCHYQGIDILDITDLRNPLVLDTIPVAYPGAVDAVIGEEGIVYFGLDEIGILVVDVDADAPTVIKTISLDGPGRKNLLRNGDTLYLVGSLAGDAYGMMTFDISEPTNPVMRESVDLPGGSGATWSADGSQIYSASGDVTIVDVSGSRIEGFEVIEVPGSGKTVTADFSGGYAYTSAGWEGLQILEVQPQSDSFSSSFATAIVPVLHGPSEIILDSTSVDENQSVNAVVGLLATADLNSNDAFTYSLIAGDGDADNSSFEIVNNELQTKEVFDYEAKHEYSVRIRSTDSSGLFVEKQFVINVEDINEIAPIITAPTAGTATPFGAVSFTEYLGNSISIADLDAGTSPVEITLTADYGTISLKELPDALAVTFVANDGIADSTLTLRGTVEDINTALGWVVYRPANVEENFYQWTVEEGGNGHWYEFVESPLTWDDAQATAVSRGGHLATITTAEENTFVGNVIPNSVHTWIGGYQDTSSPSFSEPAGGWRWITDEPWSDVSWLSGNPGNNADYINPSSGAGHLIFGHLWNGTKGWWDCDHRFPQSFVIEYDSDPRDSSPTPHTASVLIEVNDLGGGNPTHSLASSATVQIAIQSPSTAASPTYPTAASNLDPLFGVGGKATLSLSDSVDYIHEISLQDSGQILGVGSKNNHFAIYRLNSDLGLDATFGVNGVVEIDFGDGIHARAIEVDESGRIVAVGGDQIVRLNADGSLDTSFGGQGWVTADHVQQAWDIEIRPDGALVVGGGDDSLFRVALWSESGQRLSTKQADFMEYGKDFGRALVGETDGSVEFYGMARKSWDLNDTRSTWMRIDSFDEFLGHGTIKGHNLDFVHSAISLPDGRALLVGRSDQDTLEICVITRESTRSSRGHTATDNTFGTDGRTVFELGTSAEGYRATVTPDGKILVSGVADIPQQSGGTKKVMVVVRLLAVGTPDPLFGENGVTQIEFDSDAHGYAIIQLPDGKIVVAGRVGDDVALVRLLGDSPNASPTLDALSPITINEDASEQTVSLTGITAGGGETQVLSVTATSNNSGLIPDPTVIYPGADWMNNGLLAHYPLDGDVTDASGNGNDGTTVGVLSTPNRFDQSGMAYEFDGVDDSIDIGSALGNFGTSPFTVSAWIKTNTDSVADVILAKGTYGSGTSQSYFRVYEDPADPADQRRIQLNLYDGTNTQSIFSSSIIDSERWYHVVGQRDDVGMKIYIDGQLDNANNTAPINPDSSEPLKLGVADSWYNMRMDGAIDDVRIYDRALTANEVESLYALNMGTLQFTPVANQNGTATITVTVEDGGFDNDLSTTGDNATTSQTFDVAVMSVNDAPTLSPITGRTVFSDDFESEVASHNAALSKWDVSGGTVDVMTVGDSRTTPLGWTESFGLVVDLDGSSSNGAAISTKSGISLTPGEYLLRFNVSGSGDPHQRDDSFSFGLEGLFTENLNLPYTSSVQTHQKTFWVEHATVAKIFFDQDQAADNYGVIIDNVVLIQSGFVISEDFGTSTVQVTGVTAGPNETQDVRVTAVSSDLSLITIGSVSQAPRSDAIEWTTASGGNGHFFEHIPDFMSWDDAQAYAIARGGYLATVTSEAEDNFIYDMLPIGEGGSSSKVEPFLGGYQDLTADDYSEPLGGWRWVSGETWSYEDWDADAGDPNNASGLEHKLFYVRQGGRWGDSAGLRSFVIEYDTQPYDRSLELVSQPNQHGATTITVTVEDGGLDNDLNTAGDNATISQTFNVIVTPVNDPPTLNPISDLVLPEDSLTQFIRLSGVTAGGGETQPLHVTATSSNPSLLINPAVTSIVDLGVDNRLLGFTPLPDQYGVATITVTVEDGGLDLNLDTTEDNATFSQTFDVTVTPDTDDPPSLVTPHGKMFIHETLSGEPQVSYQLPAVNVNGEAINGLFNRITAASSDTALIPDPTVLYASADVPSSLSFTPVANANGTATLSIQVEDGGPDNDFATTEDNRQATHQVEVNVLEVISNQNSAILAKDSTENLYVNTQPVVYHEQQAQSTIAGFAAIGASSEDGENALLVERDSVTNRLVTDDAWRINGLFDSLQNESSPVLDLSGREVSGTLNIAAVAGAYEINGVNNPTLVVRRGQTYTFNLNTAGHPFWLQTTGNGYLPENSYNKYFQGQGRTEGEHLWVVSADAPDEIFYQCEFHPVMFGKIIVVD